MTSSATTSHGILEEHYKKNYGTLVKKYTRAAGSVWDAEDVVQTAYERALRYFVVGNVDNFDAWFGNIVRNSLIDKINEGRGIILEELDEHDHEAVSTLTPIQLRHTIVKLIETENEDHRPILDLHFLKGYSAKDIYEHNKLSYPNTRKIIQRFRDKLRKEIEDK